jgi:heme oxygenase
MIAATDTRPVRAPPAPRAGPGLAAVLRERTRDAHEAVEAAFALDARLADRASYARLLLILRGVHLPAERMLARTEGWADLRPRIDPASRARAAALDDDLRLLGVAAGDVPADPAGVSLAHGLGCLYVLEGSALGGQIIARVARRRLGDDVPLSFLASTARPDLGRDFGRLRAALDHFGRDRPRCARDEVVAGAREAFGRLTEALREEPTR